MILSAQTIRRQQLVRIEPFTERTVHESGLSYGLSGAGYDVRIAEDVSIQTGQFKLASIVEWMELTGSVLATVHDKSTWARQGLAVQNTVIEPGWKGFLTIELTNHGPLRLDIRIGTPIAQIIFQRLDEPTEMSYTGKYQNQEAGPQRARFE